MNEDILKQKVQRVIVIIGFLILCGKFIAFFLTNSVGILTDAMESIVNVIAGLVSLYSLYYAAKPKDKGHPYGHGKAELISASLEGILIMVAGGIIIYEGVMRLFNPATIEKLDIGIVVIAVAGLLNYIMGVYSIRVGKKYKSMALVAGGKHLQSDTYSTIGLVIGLLILYFTNITWIDSALALIFGSIILITGIAILRKTTGNLMDKADNQILEEMLEFIVEKREKEWIDIHNMRIIKSGSYYFVDCDLTLPWFYTIAQGHDSCDKLEAVITSYHPRIILLTHMDSCKESFCSHCSLDSCIYRNEPFVAPLTLTIDVITNTDREPEMPV